jgi:long-chain acyl-CoA synthetase
VRDKVAPRSAHFLLSLRAEETPLALCFADTGTGLSLTYGESLRLVANLADALAARGAQPGQRVALVGENGVALALCYLACVARGVWPLLVNARVSALERETIFAHARPRLAVFTSNDFSEARTQGEPPKRRSPLKVSTYGSEARDTEGALPCVDVLSSLGVAIEEPYPTAEPESEVDIGALIYTSGTTGVPKGVLLTHENLLFVAATSSGLRRLEPTDRVCGMLPVSHVYGLSSVFLATLHAGASLHFVPRFEPESFCTTLRERDLTVLQTVPAVYFKLLAHLAASDATDTMNGSAAGSTAGLFPALRYLHCGGAPLEPDLKRRVEEAFGLPLNNGYGLTETSPTVAQTRLDAPRADCSVGQPVPGVEVRVEADGELFVRGPGVMRGYYREPERTREVLDGQGWFRTGDLARQDADGALHILGRKKELIVRSGFNVYPAEVEAALLSHPALAAAAVVGVAQEANETVVAFVVLSSCAIASEEELRAFAAVRLSPYKRPARVWIVEALPTTHNGKVRKNELAMRARELIAAEELRG